MLDSILWVQLESRTTVLESNIADAVSNLAGNNCIDFGLNICDLQTQEI